MWPPDLKNFPPLFRNLFQAFVDKISGNEPKDGFGIRVSDAPGGGKSIDWQQDTDSGGATPETEWEVSVINGEDGLQWGASYYSKLFNSTANGDTLPITGLLDNTWTTGYLDINPTGDLLFIEVEFTAASWPTVTSTTVKAAEGLHLPGGGAVEYIQTTDGDGNTIYVQSYARYVLARTDVDSDENQIVVNTHRGGGLVLKQYPGVTGYLSDGSGERSIMVAMIEPGYFSP